MDDLKQRLRELAANWRYESRTKRIATIHAAADHIERLEGLLRRWQAEAGVYAEEMELWRDTRRALDGDHDPHWWRTVALDGEDE